MHLKHLYRKPHGQSKCVWCGAFVNGLPCRLDSGLRRALRQFAVDNGKTWRSKLIRLWESGQTATEELQQVRNIIGPSGLYRISIPVLQSLDEEFT